MMPQHTKAQQTLPIERSAVLLLRQTIQTGVPIPASLTIFHLKGMTITTITLENANNVPWTPVVHLKNGMDPIQKAACLL